MTKLVSFLAGVAVGALIFMLAVIVATLALTPPIADPAPEAAAPVEGVFAERGVPWCENACAERNPQPDPMDEAMVFGAACVCTLDEWIDLAQQVRPAP